MHLIKHSKAHALLEALIAIHLLTLAFLMISHVSIKRLQHQHELTRRGYAALMLAFTQDLQGLSPEEEGWHNWQDQLKRLVPSGYLAGDNICWEGGCLVADTP